MAIKKYGKGFGVKGWTNYDSDQSKRHSLASQGICTGRKSNISIGLSKVNYSKSFTPVTYSGHWVDGEGHDMSFNLYGFEDIDFDATKEAIMDNMNRHHLVPMKKLFSEYGIELKKFEWYSPKAYNFAGDSVDLVVKVKDKDKLKQFIKDNKVEIQKRLDSNKSYDGYLALTSSDVDEVINKIDSNGDVDTMVVSYIQEKHPLDQYEDFFDLIDYENTTEDGRQ